MLFLLAAAALAATVSPDLIAARDHQDLASLDKQISTLQASASNTEGQYKLAVAYSYAAEVAMELHDKKKSEAYAEKGYEVAQKIVSADSSNPEYHRVLGQLCGQVIPANPFMGTLKYGPCARDEINKAIQLNDKLALAYVSRGVGNYYLPASMGGGLDVAMKDFDKATALDPKLAEAYLWKGVALAKANRPAEARTALEAALKLDPDRLWTKQELAKLPAR